MKLTVQVVVHPEDDAESATVVREVFAVDRDALVTDTLGLHLCEAQDLLAAVQDTMVTHQVSTALSAQVGVSLTKLLSAANDGVSVGGGG